MKHINLALIAILCVIPSIAFGQAQQQPVVVTSATATGANVTQPVGNGSGNSTPMPVTISGGSSANPCAGTSGATAPTFSCLGGYIDGTGKLQFVSAGFPLPVTQTGAIPAGTNIIGKVSIDQTTPGTTNGVVTNSGSVASTTPAQRTIVTLDVKIVTTGGTAVTAITAGHRTAGGYIQNPPSATINLCINEIGTATGTTSSGDTTCIYPGQSYALTPAAGAVSVISSDSSHPFSGYGLN